MSGRPPQLSRAGGRKTFDRSAESDESGNRPDDAATIAVVVLTYNRVHLLRQCVENVIERISARTSEIVIWNNASTDGTRDYLDSLSIDRLSVVHAPANIGQNAYDQAIALTRASHLVELDDDVIDAPAAWDATMLEAFLRLPEFGFLAANLANNPHDVTAQIMYGENAHLYHIAEINGIELKMGPTGGGCTMTSRALYDSVGGFGQSKLAFWLEDAKYIGKIMEQGYRAAYLNGLEVVHAGGEYYAPIPDSKHRYWEWRERRQRRREIVKGFLLRIPVVPQLNRKYGWFVPLSFVDRLPRIKGARIAASGSRIWEDESPIPLLRSPLLGHPDVVYLDGTTLTQVFGRPGAVRLFISQTRLARSSPIIDQTTTSVSGVTTSSVRVADSSEPGLWTEGKRRIVGSRQRDHSKRNTLVYVRDGARVCIEGSLSRALAVRIASTLR